MSQDSKSSASYVVYVDQDFEDIVPEFIESVHENVEEMKASLNANDIQSIQRIGHNLKGTGGGYGFEKLSELGGKIEESAKNTNTDAIHKLITEISDYLSRVEIRYVEM